MRRSLILLFSTIAVSLAAQNVLTLQDVVKKTLENNYNIRIAQNETYINTANNTMGNAGMLPDVSLNFGQVYNFNNTRQEFFSGDIREGNNARTTNTNANIQANWTLFDGMQMFINRDKLREFENLGMINLKLMMENTVYQVMETYLMIEYQKKRINTIQEALGVSKERIDLAKLRKEVGTASDIDVLQAEVDINADSSVLINQLLVLRNLKVRLNNLMVSDTATDFETTDVQSFPLVNLDELTNNAISRNKLLELSDKNIVLANLTIGQWEANKYPVIDLNTGYSFSRMNAEIGLLKFNQNAGFSAGLTGRWNLFNGFNNKREIQVAKLNLESQKLRKEQVWADLKSDILSYYNVYSNANTMVSQEDKNIGIARRNLDIMREKMRIGTVISVELRQAQLNLIDAEFRKISAENDSNMAMLELLRLSGSLLQEF